MQVTAGIVPHAFTWRDVKSNYRCCVVVALLFCCLGVRRSCVVSGAQLQCWYHVRKLFGQWPDDSIHGIHLGAHVLGFGGG